MCAVYRLRGVVTRVAYPSYVARMSHHFKLFLLVCQDDTGSVE